MNPEFVIGVSGEIRAGKNAVTELIATACGPENCCIVEGSTILEEMLRHASHPTPCARSAQQTMWTTQKEALGDQKWLTDEIKSRLEKSGKKIWIFLGFRMPSDIAFIQSYPRWTIFYVTAPFAMRLEWAQKSTKKEGGKSNEPHITKEDFARMHTKQTEQFVRSIEELEKVQVIPNTYTFRALGAQVISALLTRGILSAIDIASRKEALEALYAKLESQ